MPCHPSFRVDAWSNAPCIVCGRMVTLLTKDRSCPGRLPPPVLTAAQVTAAAFAGTPDQMPVLTLWPTWAAAVVHGGKDRENRNWKPFAILQTSRLAIHSGQRPFCSHDWAVWWDQLNRCAAPERSKLQHWTPGQVWKDSGHIIGTCRVTGCELTADSSSPWAGGAKYAWILDDVRPCFPIRVKGAQGLWKHSRKVIEDATVAVAGGQLRGQR